MGEKNAGQLGQFLSIFMTSQLRKLRASINHFFKNKIAGLMSKSSKFELSSN